jgi:hypothetical protein
LVMATPSLFGQSFNLDHLKHLYLAPKDANEVKQLL